MLLKQLILFLWYLIIFLLPRQAFCSDGVKISEPKEVEEFFKEFQEKYDKHYSCEEEYQNRLQVRILRCCTVTNTSKMLIPNLLIF